MRGRSVGIAASCALGARALIIPPGVGISAENNVAPDFSISVVDPKQRMITVPCPECAFSTRPEKIEDAEDEDEFVWIQGGANSVVLNFTISEDGEYLRLNDEGLWPPQFVHDGGFPHGRLEVKQVPSNTRLVDIKSGEVRSADLEVTAYGVAVDEDERQPLSATGDSLLSVHFQLRGLENEYMRLDEVIINMLKTSAGELLIIDVTTKSNPEKDFLFPPPPPDMDDMPEDDEDFPPGPPSPFFHHGPPHDLEHFPEDEEFPPGPPPPWFHHRPHGPQHDFKQKECNMLPEPLCKFKNMLESTIDEAMGPPPSHGFRKPGCRKGQGQGKHLPGHIKGPHFMRPGAEEERGKGHHGRPHHMRPHGGHHHHHHGHHGHHHHGHMFRHHFLHAFAKGMVAVLIPVMAGITVGMTVSLLGLVVGRLIGFLWIRLVRGGRRGYASVALEEEQDFPVVDEDEEGKGMLAEMEAPPPVYEDAPAYEEVEKGKAQQ